MLNFWGLQRMIKIVTLNFGAAVLFQENELFFIFDPFGNGAAAQFDTQNNGVYNNRFIFFLSLGQ